MVPIGSSRRTATEDSPLDARARIAGTTTAVAPAVAPAQAMRRKASRRSIGSFVYPHQGEAGNQGRRFGEGSCAIDGGLPVLASVGDRSDVPEVAGELAVGHVRVGHVEVPRITDGRAPRIPECEQKLIVV